jgi:hypothetical protein
MKQVFLGAVIAVMAMSIALAQTKSQTAVPSNSETLADAPSTKETRSGVKVGPKATRRWSPL